MSTAASVSARSPSRLSRDSSGLLILENTFHTKGGPARHLHYAQDEWFCVLEGEFLIEVGEQRMRLRPGDSLLAPRQVPHRHLAIPTVEAQARGIAS